MKLFKLLTAKFAMKKNAMTWTNRFRSGTIYNVCIEIIRKRAKRKILDIHFDALLELKIITAV